jgi:hypothetical protein
MDFRQNVWSDAGMKLKFSGTTGTSYCDVGNYIFLIFFCFLLFFVHPADSTFVVLAFDSRPFFMSSAVLPPRSYGAASAISTFALRIILPNTRCG